MIVSEYAHGPEDALSIDQKELVLKAMTGLHFDYTYVTPVVKCPHVRTPTKIMMDNCQDLLEKEIEAVKPTVIITLGKGPAGLFDVTGKITNIKMMIFDVVGCPGQRTWGYNPKLIITENIDKVLGDINLLSNFLSAFKKAERFKQPGAKMDSGIISYGMFDNPAEFNQWVDVIMTMEKAPIISADIEATGKDPWNPRARMRCISFCWAEGKSRCVPFEEDAEGYLPILKKLMENMHVSFIFFNAVYDMKYLRVVHGIKVINLEADVKHMAYLLDPTLGAYGYALKPLSQEYTTLGAYDTEVKEDEDDTNPISIWERIPMDTLAPYCCGDTDSTLRLYHIFLKKLIEYQMVQVLRIMTNGLFVLMEMEINGILIDQELVKDYTPKLIAIVAKYEAELVEHAGKVIDWNSPNELGKLLYKDLGYVHPSGDGSRTTDENTMEIFNTPLTNAILKYRKASKALNTYMLGYFSADKLGADGRLRGSFHQTGTRTGRLSSSDPNLQNISKGIAKEDPAYPEMKDIKIKKVIVARPGWKIMQADLSQAEFRVVTCASKDPDLIYTYMNDIDVHSNNAKKSFNIKKDLTTIIKEATDLNLIQGSDAYKLYVLKKELQLIKKEDGEQRDASKSLSFGILYGMREQGLKYDLDKKTRRKGRIWSLQECRESIANFHKGYRKLSRYLEYLKEFARKNGYVKNLFGRRRWLPNINSKDWKLKGKDLNAAINTPTQGASADLMLCGMYGVYCELDHEKAKMIMTVHDSLVLEVRDDYLQECAQIVAYHLENPKFNGKPLPFLCIPIKADVQVAQSYGGFGDEEFEFTRRVA